MKRKLTNRQRQAITKICCFALSAALFAGSLFAVPHIVRAIPHFGGTRSLDLSKSYSDAETPKFPLSAGLIVELKQELSPPATDEENKKPVQKPLPQEGDLMVFSENFCWYDAGETPTLNIINSTDYNVNLNDYLSRDYNIGNISENSPLVLIVHTHGSESYLPSGYDFYSPDEDFRSTDKTETVVHIGNMLSTELNSLGINTIHDETMYDLTDFNSSYGYSRKGIQKWLEKYPSIRFVIDVHRDSVFDSKGNNVKPLTKIDGKDCAQLMLVVGTNSGSVYHPDWKTNLTFATKLQNQMNDMYPTLARPVNLRTAAFNQDLTAGSLLLEAGACGNTVEEVENSIKLFAKAYAETLFLLTN